MDKHQFEEKLILGLRKMNIGYREEYLEMLWEYMHFLLAENKKYNLTAIDEPGEIINKHFFDSLTLLSERKLKAGYSLIDVGTGAGFPGLVLKIFFPNIRLVLLDSLAKRINFLRKLVNKLGLSGVEAIHSRAEDLGKDHNYRGSFDWVVSRAVAPLNILSEYTLPFAREGGSVALYKGPDFQVELEEAKRAISLLGGELMEVKEVKVPDLKGERYIIFLKKVTGTPSKYPRRAGIPKKRPL